MSNNKIRRLDDEDLNVILDAELNDANGYLGNSGLVEARKDAMNHYMGAKFTSDRKLDKNQSQYVSRDVQDVIEWIMPQMSEIFLSNENVVEFEPVGPEDVELARQETLYTQYVIFRQNKGFLSLHNHIKDGLLSRLAVLKHWWDDAQHEEREEYENVSSEELRMLLGDDNAQLIEHTAYLPDGTETNEVLFDEGVTHDVVLIRSWPDGKVVIENVPPEEFVFSRRAKDKESMDYCAHLTKKTVSELIAMGFSREKVEALAARAFELEDRDNQEEQLIRHQDDEIMAYPEYRQRVDFAMRELAYEEHYIRVDADGDGLAELRMISRVGNEILVNEVIPELPFTFFSPILMPHKLVGRSVADLVEDLQVLKSKLIRSMLDNIDQANRGKWTVLQGMVNIDDILSPRPMGIIRQKVNGAVQRLDSPHLPPEAFQMLAYVDGVREERSGVSKVQSGLDSKALGSNTAASAVSQVMSASMQRIQLIARVYAETAMKELVRSVHGLITRNEKQSKVVRVTNTFIPVDPAEFKCRYDLTVSAGIGTATRDQKMMHLTMLGQDLAMVAQMGGLESGLITPKNVYNLIAEKARVMGFKDGDSFINNPDNLPPPAPEQNGPSPEEIQAQVEQAKMQMEQQKMAMEAEKAQVDAQLKQTELQLKQAELQLKQAEAAGREADRALEGEKIRLEHQLRMAELALRERELEAEIRLGRDIKIGG